MKKLYLTILFTILAYLSHAQSNIDNEKEIIKEVIQTAYVEGLQNEGDAAKIESGFHEHFHLIGIAEGDEMWHLNITDWKTKQVKKRVAGELPLSGKNIITVDFKSIDISGTAAMVKLEYYVGKKLTYIDYISLYKFESGWKMVNKIFYKL